MAFDVDDISVGVLLRLTKWEEACQSDYTLKGLIEVISN